MLTSILAHLDCQITIPVKHNGHTPELKEDTIKTNASLSILDWERSFFILEAAVSRTREHLLSRAKKYKYGNKGHIKILALLELRADCQGQYRVLVTIWRLKKVATPTAENAHSFRNSCDILYDLLEVFPRKPKELLRITLRDLVNGNPPRYNKYQEVDKFIDIPLATLRDIGKRAVEAKIKEDQEGGKKHGSSSMMNLDEGRDSISTPMEGSDESEEEGHNSDEDV